MASTTFNLAPSPAPGLAAEPQGASAPKPRATPVPPSSPGTQDTLGGAFGRFKRRVKTAASQTAKVFEPSQYAPMFRPTANLVGGAGVVAASSLGFAAAVAKPLARMTLDNPGATELYKSVPFFGSFINQALGKAGALGALAIAGPLLGLVLTFVQSQGRASDRLHWFLSHAAMGLAMSPVWLLPVASALGVLPALAVAGACMLGVSVLLSERVDKKQASVQMLLLGTILIFGGAPIPALLVTGVSVGAAITTAAVTLAGGAVMLAGFTMFSNFAALSDDSTAELRACGTKSDLSEWRLNLPGEKDPTVICSEPMLTEYVQFLKNQLADGKRLDVCKILMSGRPGTGKTAISRSMGHALGAKTYLISPSKIMATENPAQAVRNLFAQAKLMGGRAIFFFDDAEVLFGDRKSDRKLEGGFDTLTLLTTTLNDCLDGIERDGYEMLLVVLSTNNKDYLDDSIKQRFARCSVEIQPPDEVHFGEQLATCYRRCIEKQYNVNGLSRQQVKQLAVLPATVMAYAKKQFTAETAHAQPVHIVGREMVMLCDFVLQDLNVVQKLAGRDLPTEAQLLVAFQRSWDKVVGVARANQKNPAQAQEV